MSNDWFNINNIVNLQKSIIYDINGNTSAQSQSVINNLAGNLSNLSTAISGSTVLPTLTYQNEVNSILDRENQRLAERKQAIDIAEMGQKRMIDLTTSETLRRSALNKMYIVITIAILVYLGIRLLIPTFIADILIIFLVVGTIVMLLVMYSDHIQRNNMDYNLINLGDPAQMTASSSDSSSGSSSGSSSKNLLNINYSGCFKQSCCAEGSTFNDKYSICVPNNPPNNGNTETGFKYFFASGSWENPDKCSNGYSLTDLACTGNVVSGFTTINSTSDFAKPNGPNEFVDYNLYK